jgi:hypothetical protein
LNPQSPKIPSNQCPPIHSTRQTLGRLLNHWPYPANYDRIDRGRAKSVGYTMRLSTPKAVIVFLALLAAAGVASFLVSPSRTAEKPFTLLVTWLVYNQPPASYQTEFSSQQACEAARNQIVKEQNRLAGNAIAENQALKAEWAGKGIVGPPSIPEVATVCAAKAADAGLSDNLDWSAPIGQPFSGPTSQHHTAP